MSQDPKTPKKDFAGGYKHGLAIENNDSLRKIDAIEDFAAHRLNAKIPFAKNKPFSEGYKKGKKDMAVAKAAEEKKKNKKEINLNMPMEKFKKLTPKEQREYKRKADEMDRKTKEGYDKAKKQDFKNGGTVKTHTMPDGTKMKGAKHGMKHGGAVKGKKCRMDGIAVRGRTRAKQRSK